MLRWFLGLAPALVIVASCSSFPDATTSTDAGGSGDDTGGGSGDDSGAPASGDDSGAGSMDSGGGGGDDSSLPPPQDSGPKGYDVNLPDVALPCVTGAVPGPPAFPFPVDEYFVASGWMMPMYINPPWATPTCTQRAPVTTDAGVDQSKVKCWAFSYTPPDAATTWAGVDWQFPNGNWGTQTGLGVPAGAKKLSFYAWGATGTEVVTFNVGYGATSPDVFGGSLKQALTTTPTQYSIDLTTDNYVCNSIRMGFGWVATGGVEMTFYIDQIVWE